MSNRLNVLVTGGNGFLGSNLVPHLRGVNCEVSVIGRRTGHDLRDKGVLLRYLNNHRVDAVVHLAASVGGIGANRLQPAVFWHNNLQMGLNVLAECAELGIRKLLMMGSTCSYPKSPKTIPFVEEELFDGMPEGTNAPYGIAKRALIVGAQAFRDEYKLNAVTLIPTNLYGPGDQFEGSWNHVIPAMIKRFHDAKREDAPSVTLWGSGAATRDFLYVQDACWAIGHALRGYDSPEPLNIGSGVETSIRDLAEMVRVIVGYNGAIEWDLLKPDGQPRRVLNCKKAKERLGWGASTDLMLGLRKTYDWYCQVNERV